jgi:hypothetical protein
MGKNDICSIHMKDDIKQHIVNTYKQPTRPYIFNLLTYESAFILFQELNSFLLGKLRLGEENTPYSQTEKID